MENTKNVVLYTKISTYIMKITYISRYSKIMDRMQESITESVLRFPRTVIWI